MLQTRRYYIVRRSERIKLKKKEERSKKKEEKLLGRDEEVSSREDQKGENEKERVQRKEWLQTMHHMQMYQFYGIIQTYQLAYK